MKNTKNMLLSMTIIAALCSAQSAQSAEFFDAPTIEIFNKKEECVVAITNLNNGAVMVMGIPSNQTKRHDTDINAKLKMQFWSLGGRPMGAFIINAPGKTKYLSWNTAKSIPLYPQTGPLKGLFGRYNPFGKGTTESGLSLSNNITEKQITKN